MTLNAVTDSTSSVTHTAEGKTQVTTATRDETLRGTTLSGTNGVTAYAVGDLTATAATITSNQGKAVVASDGDVTLQAGIERHDISRDTQKHDEGTFTSTSTRTHDAIHDQVAVGTLVSGDKVTVQGTNVTVTGSNVVSDHGTTMVAKNNLTLQAATTTTTQEHSKEVEKNGLMGNGGPSVTLGTQTKSAESRSTQTYATASNVGAVDGSVILVAGDHYQQIGSNVLAPNGDIDIHAKRVDITEARETGTQTDETHFRQSGLTVAVSSPVIAALQTATDMHRAAGNTSDSRMQALAGVTTGLAAYNAGTGVAADPKAGGGLGISATIGSARSDSKTTTVSDTAAGSNVTAGGNVRISATGGGQDSNLTIQGSNVHADGSVALAADNRINLLAAKNSVDTTSASSSSSGGVGVAATVGSGGMSVGITANASAAKGKGDSSDVTWTNTHISAGNQVVLSSGGDTTLKGAVVDANQVIGDIKGNLNIESLQDTSDYRSKNQSLGGSVTVGMGVSGSVNASQQQMDSHYASITEQSGIHAGDGGFQIKVGGKTDLKGGAITSSDQAVADGLNHFTTGTLTVSDITNKAEYSASSVSLGGGYSKGPSGVGTDQKGQAITGNAVPGSTLPSLGGLSAQTPIALGASDKDSSTTRSGISGGQITITDDAAQRALTGQGADDTLASLNRDVVTGVDGTNALKPIFNEKEIQADFAIAGGFARETGTFINNKAKEGDAKKAEAKDALAQANDPTSNLTDEQRQALRDKAATLNGEAQSIDANWGAGGTYRQITTALAAAAGGNVSGSTAQLAQAAVVSYVQQQGASYIGQLVANGTLIEGSPEHAALHAILACAGAAASSQGCGAGAMGAAASSLLTGLFSDTNPDETAAQREAKRNLIINLVDGIAGMTDASGAGTANNAATVAVDNNWLATQQVVQFNKEWSAAKTPVEQLQVAGKWYGVSKVQDIATQSGVVQGLLASGINDLAGMGEFLQNPQQGIDGIKALIQDPELRQQMTDAVFKELNSKIDIIQKAMDEGGVANAYDLGAQVGSLIWQVGGVVAGAEGAAKGSVTLSKLGINATKDGLKAMANIAKADGMLASKSLYTANGVPLMDFSTLTNAQKGVVGEVLGGESVQTLIPDAEKIGRSPGVGQNGIDDLYKVNRPDVDYVIVEYKFGSSKLGDTADGVQLSDSWSTGAITGENRILKSVDDPTLARNIETSLRSDRVERWVVHTDPYGNVSVGMVDKNGKFVPDPQGASKILGGKQ